MNITLLKNSFILISFLLITTLQIQAQVTNGMAAEGILGQVDFSRNSK